MSDWMARPTGRFFIWFVYMLASLGAIGLLFGLVQLVDWGVTWLTGSQTAALIVGFLCLMMLVSAFNAWIWTATGNRYVQALIRVMQRMEGR